jgi:two-component system, chemotaxis family, CheB/CheR fusion protein
MKILYVEDHPAVAQITINLLSAGLGHEVEHVENGTAALEAASRFHPDLVLIDIGLPDIDGYEVARRLRQQPEFEKLLLVALTGYTQHEYKQKAYEAGFDAHFAKPMDFAELEKVERRTDGRRSGKSL